VRAILAPIDAAGGRGITRSMRPVVHCQRLRVRSIVPVPAGQGRSYQDRVGVVSILDVPDRKQRSRFTKQVRDKNTVLPPTTIGFVPWPRRQRSR
jgi:hypothetical protein